MHKFYIILFLSYFYHGFLQAEIINKIEISGNKRVSNETIIAYGDIDINRDYSEEDLNKILDGITKPKDMVITLGAGSIWRYSESYLKHLNSNSLGKIN